VSSAASDAGRDQRTITLFLCGDVMTGRGIDQILPHPGRPELFEPVVTSAKSYVELAEARSGPIPRGVDFAYVWGDAPAELARAGARVRIANLETAVTTSDEAWPGKMIHYRMHPANTPCLSAAAIDCCVLANNHVLDWGRAGLSETLAALRRAGIATAGAGADEREAQAPAVIEVPGAGRVLVFGLGEAGSGIPRAWAAGPRRSGVSWLADLRDSAEALARRVAAAKRAGDIAVASIHWGPNWGFAVSPEEQSFARRLIDDAAVDVVHGHSSHHVRGIEVYRDRPILYGCGDLLNDYEGIEGYEAFRGDVGAMYFPELDAETGRLVRFAIAPTRIQRFRIERADDGSARWLLATLDREGRALGTRVERRPDGWLQLHWSAH
jgi:poly-gamma-glutamate synthesis protein (capsule biosynthesis protein)